MKFDRKVFFENLWRKLKFHEKSDNNGTSPEDVPVYIYGDISLNSSYSEKFFKQNLYRKSKHTFCLQ